MKILCLGGAGVVCRHAAKDLIESPDVQEVAIGDVNPQAGAEVVRWLDSPKAQCINLNIVEPDAVETLRQFDLVVDGTPVTLNRQTASRVLEAGIHGVNLNGRGSEWGLHEQFAQKRKIFVPGYGVSPGLANSLAQLAAEKLDTIRSIRISEAAFRPLAPSPGLAEATCLDYDESSLMRVVFENEIYPEQGPFSRLEEIEFPEPFGKLNTYILPRPQTKTLSLSMKAKGVERVEVRGALPPREMSWLSAFHETGILSNAKIEAVSADLGILDVVACHLLQAAAGQSANLNGMALKVEVDGVMLDAEARCVYTMSYPDFSGEEASGIEGFARPSGIMLSIAAQLILLGKVTESGVIAPEVVFEPEAVLSMLKERGIGIKRQIDLL